MPNIQTRQRRERRYSNDEKPIFNCHIFDTQYQIKPSASSSFPSNINVTQEDEACAELLPESLYYSYASLSSKTLSSTKQQKKPTSMFKKAAKKAAVSDIALTVLGKFAPPVPVYMKKGVSPDLLVNTGLCLFGGLPAILHSWYIIYKNPENKGKRQGRVNKYPNRPLCDCGCGGYKPTNPIDERSRRMYYYFYHYKFGRKSNSNDKDSAVSSSITLVDGCCDDEYADPITPTEFSQNNDDALAGDKFACSNNTIDVQKNKEPKQYQQQQQHSFFMHPSSSLPHVSSHDMIGDNEFYDKTMKTLLPPSYQESQLEHYRRRNLFGNNHHQSRAYVSATDLCKLNFNSFNTNKNNHSILLDDKLFIQNNSSFYDDVRDFSDFTSHDLHTSQHPIIA